MKLYYSPGACSLSPHIVAHEAGIPITLEKVDTQAKRTAGGRDYLEIVPKGYVPALELDDGQVLTEGPAIVQYLADLRPEKGLAPANGTFARSRLQEALGYINSEIHKTYSPLFKPDTPDATREERKAYLRKRYALVEQTLARQPWLLGDHFTVADAYLFVVTNWAKAVELDLSDFPALLAFQARVAARPGVQAAMAAEGLIKSARAA
jgi:glutathione S-transferase